MIRENRFKIGDIVVYQPRLPKKIIKRYYGPSIADKIGKHCKVTTLENGQNDCTIGVRFYRCRKDLFFTVSSLQLIKGVPRHPLTNIFSDQK